MQGHSQDSSSPADDGKGARVLAEDEALGAVIRASLEPDCPALLVLAPSDSSSASRSGRLAAIQGAAAAWARREGGRLILVSSAAVYGPDYRSTEFVTEEAEKRPSIENAESDWWIEIEAAVLKAAGERADEVLILRPAAIVGAPRGRFFGRFFQARVVFPCAGFDPSVQLITAESLADCIRTAFEKQLAGVYNVAPDDVAPLSGAMRFLGIRSLPIARFLQVLIRPGILKKIDGVNSISQLNFSRYPNTISGEKFARDTGVSLSTRAALEKLRRDRFPASEENVPEFDPFGLNESFFEARGKTLHCFLEKFYWRIERKGLEHLPESGPALIVGPHRGFMPLDAVMLFHLITKYTGRLPRFLIHPTLVKFPLQARYFRRLGGLLACQKNGDWVLRRGGLLGVFPEGIEGTFKKYRDAYKLGRFGWRNYIRWSLEYRAPIVPFTIVGSAEIFPILWRIKWKWFKAYMEWPFLPITPTFPLIWLPLPSKWHVQLLPPIDPGQAEAEALETGESVERLIARRVRDAIETATTEMRSKQRSIFWGSVFEDEGET